MFPLETILGIGSKILDKVFPDPAQAEQAKLKLLELQQSGALAQLQAEAADLDSARKREMAVATSENAPFLNKIVTPVLALGVLVATFILFGLVMFAEGVVDSTRKDIIIYVLGVLSAISTQIISYYFGSSKGSTDKSMAIDKILTK